LFLYCYYSVRKSFPVHNVKTKIILTD
jgi:hypothetical protein